MERGTKERKRHSGKENSTAGKIWRAVRPLLTFLISAGICVFVFVFAFNKVKEKLFSPVDINDATPVGRRREHRVPRAYNQQDRVQNIC